MRWLSPATPNLRYKGIRNDSLNICPAIPVSGCVTWHTQQQCGASITVSDSLSQTRQSITSELLWQTDWRLPVVSPTGQSTSGALHLFLRGRALLTPGSLVRCTPNPASFEEMWTISIPLLDVKAFPPSCH